MQIKIAAIAGVIDEVRVRLKRFKTSQQAAAKNIRLKKSHVVFASAGFIQATGIITNDDGGGFTYIIKVESGIP